SNWAYAARLPSPANTSNAAGAATLPAIFILPCPFPRLSLGGFEVVGFKRCAQGSRVTQGSDFRTDGFFDKTCTFNRLRAGTVGARQPREEGVVGYLTVRNRGPYLSSTTSQCGCFRSRC